MFDKFISIGRAGVVFFFVCFGLRAQGAMLTQANLESTLSESQIDKSTASSPLIDRMTVAMVDGTLYSVRNATKNTSEASSSKAVIATAQVVRFDMMTISFSGTSVPEPTSLSLIGLGAMGLLARRRHNAR